MMPIDQDQLAGAVAEIEQASAVLRRSEPALWVSKRARKCRETKLFVGLDSDLRYLDLGDIGCRKRGGRNPLSARLI
jgi:hypothetical protein